MGETTRALIADHVVSWKQRSAEPVVGDWLFSPDPSRVTYLTADVLFHRFRRRAAIAKVPGAALHRLRHAVATHLVGTASFSRPRPGLATGIPLRRFATTPMQFRSTMRQSPMNLKVFSTGSPRRWTCTTPHGPPGLRCFDDARLNGNARGRLGPLAFASMVRPLVDVCLFPGEALSVGKGSAPCREGGSASGSEDHQPGHLSDDLPCSARDQLGGRTELTIGRAALTLEQRPAPALSAPPGPAACPRPPLAGAGP